ncbi:MAG: hypothetical protein WAN04_02555, partial [Candidatus Udaeobacter sp.]
NVVLGKNCLAFRDFSSLRTHFQGGSLYIALYTYFWRMSSTNFTTTLFSVLKILLSANVIAYEERGVKTANDKSKRNPAQTRTGFAQIVSD